MSRPPNPLKYPRRPIGPAESSEGGAKVPSLRTLRTVRVRPRSRLGSMRIGYACVNTQLPSSARTVRLANATPERLLELAEANLDALAAIPPSDEEDRMPVFRVTSAL